jgi:site-specific recombinase XerD
MELVAAAADADPVTLLVFGWLASKRSEHTRTAYARDIGIIPQRGRACSWLAWCQARGVHPVTGVSGLHVALYARQLDAAGLAPATVARRLSAVAGWYAWLAERGHIALSPAVGIARPGRAVAGPAAPGLNRDQVLALLHAADAAHGPQRARTAALVAVLLFTGARIGEVIGADVEDLGTEQGHRVLWVARGDGRRRTLALPSPAATRIGTYLSGRADLASARTRRGADVRGQHSADIPGQRDNDVGGQHGWPARRPLFATGTGRRLFGGDVWRLVRRLAAQAGLPEDLVGRLGPEAMRHSFAALYLDAGGSLGDLQQVMGHADSRTTQRYGRSRHGSGGPPGEVVAAYLTARR